MRCITYVTRVWGCVAYAIMRHFLFHDVQSLCAHTSYFWSLIYRLSTSCFVCSEEVVRLYEVAFVSRSIYKNFFEK
jgi:hypothetical protein